MMRPILDVLRGLVDVARVQVEQEAATPEEVESLSSWEWLQREMKDTSSKRVGELPPGKFHPGKFHVFKYDPLHKDTLAYYDIYPVMLHLGSILVGNTRLEMGCNVSWWPPPARRHLVSKIREMYDDRIESTVRARPFQSVEQARLFLDPYRIRYMLDPLGFSFAIRHYLPDRVRSTKAVIGFEDWDRAVSLEAPRMFPVLRGQHSIGQIYQMYYRHVRDYNTNRAERLQRVLDQREDRYYNFVDR